MSLDDLFQRLLAPNAWLSVTYLAGLLMALLFRSDRIYNRTLFKVACLLFVLSLLIAPAVLMLMQLLGGATGAVLPPGSRNPNDLLELMLSLFLITASPLFLAGSILCGLFALIPPDRAKTAKPPQHPTERKHQEA